MAFGQASGPPANARRVAELADLLDARGFASFREARHPFGLTQRQAGGKFTTSEVDELITRLEAEADGGLDHDGRAGSAVAAAASRLKPAAPRAAAPAADRAARRRARQEEQVTGIDADVLATELVNRGWCCIPPD